MTNKELQALLKQYPDDIEIGAIETDPDYYEQWEVVRAGGILEMHFGYMGQGKTQACLVIS